MSSNLKEILSFIEQFENSFDVFRQSLKNNNDEILQNLTSTWKKLRTEQNEIQDLENLIRSQNLELTELRTRLDDVNKQIEIPQSKRDELRSKITSLKIELEKITDESKKPKFELDDISSKLSAINEKIKKKENEKATLEQKKINNENKEIELKSNFSKEKLEELEAKLLGIKNNSFFTSFLIEYSDEDIPEVDIIATVMTQGSCKLDDLKNLLDVPPIMAVRTIKQLALKGVINLDEDTNIITMN